MSGGINFAKLIHEYYDPKNQSPPPPPNVKPPPPPNGTNYSKITKELEAAIAVLKTKGNGATNENREAFKTKLAEFRKIPLLKRATQFPAGLGNYGPNGYPVKVGTFGLIGKAMSERVQQGKQYAKTFDPFYERRLKAEWNNATRRGNAKRVAEIQAKLAELEKQKAVSAANEVAREAAKKAAAEKAAANKKAAAEQNEAMRKVIKEALIVLNTKRGNATVNNRAAYVRAIQAYRNAGHNVSLSNRNLGVNRYSTTTGTSRTKVTNTTKKTNHYEYIKDMREKIRKNPSQQRRLLDDALSNLSKRLYATSDNKRALEMINNYRRLSSNASYTANLNRRAERRKAAKKNEKKNENKKGWSGGGQQIIFGQPAGAAPVAAPMFMPGPAAPTIIPGPTGAAPVFVPSGAGPSISVAPTIRVNVPQPAAQAAAQMLPPAERSALNNAGGYRRAASLVQNAGGPESVSRALNALQQSGGNVPKAMASSGLPRNVFANVNKLGGPVTARRTLTAVKKVSRKFEGPVKARRAISRALAAKPKSKGKKKYVSSACACKLPPANKIKLVVSQLRRKNLEKNFLKCLLP